MALVMAIVGVWFALPVVCWMFMARNGRIRQVIIGTLALCFTVEVALAQNWIASSEKYPLLAVTGGLTIIIAFTGFAVEKRLGKRLTAAGTWGMAGLCAYALMYLVVVAMLFPDLAHQQLSTQDVLPLGAGLVTTSSYVPCGGSGNYTCMTITVHGPAAMPSSAVPGLVIHQLDRQYGWHLTSAVSGGSREIGSSELCIGVSPARDGATISLGNGC
jgi:hypothetical protein